MLVRRGVPTIFGQDPSSINKEISKILTRIKGFTLPSGAKVSGISQLVRSLRYNQYTQKRFMAAAATEKPVEKSIRQKLTEAFQPTVLDVINESNMHSVPKGSETHFKVVVVAEKFDSVPLIKRHRMVNELLQQELAAGVHALSIVAKTPKQWADSEGKISKSPPCQGGAGL